MFSTSAFQVALRTSLALLIFGITAKTLSGTLAPRWRSSVDSLTRPTVAKVSVLYGEENEYYERAIASHQRHAEHHNYPLHVLRRPVADGYWNKELYLLSILIQELGKPTSARVDWVMYVSAQRPFLYRLLTLAIHRWFDADSVVLNPEIPLEIFLPANDVGDYHVLATKDQNGLNTGIFFLRVHQWSVQMLLRAVGMPIFRPDVDLGFSADQKAMALHFNETDNKDHVLYQPRTWYNTYEFNHAYEGKEGDLLVHFPGLFDNRFPHMKDWLDVVEGPMGRKWQMPLQESAYPARIEEFWKLVRQGRLRLDEAPSLLWESGTTDDGVAVVEHLRNVMHDETDQIATMKDAIDTFDNFFNKDAIGSDRMGGDNSGNVGPDEGTVLSDGTVIEASSPA